VLAPLFVDDPASNRVEYHDALLTVLGLELIVTRKDEYTGIQFRNLNLPVPSELQHLPLPAARVDLEQGNALQMCR
jgi:hypothetical protein